MPRCPDTPAFLPARSVRVDGGRISIGPSTRGLAQRCGLAALIVLSGARLASAQHADDNAVLSAEDAFGLTVGTETIGLYNPESIRGFNPLFAGNARVGGLYFDPQAPLSSRVLEGSTIRVGLSAIGFPFPAPTGIVDYDLRHVTDKPGLTALVDAGPFNAWGIDLDGQLPVPGAHLGMPVGVSLREDAYLPGYTSRTVSVGAVPQWTPSENFYVRGLIDWQRISANRSAPLIFMAQSELPPYVPARYLGQRWADSPEQLSTFGLIVDAKLGRAWTFSAGVFRSMNHTSDALADLLVDTDGRGVAEHLLIGYPEQRADSTSGEMRLTGHLVRGAFRHELVIALRGRDVQAAYNGADVQDVGSTRIDAGEQVAPPTFSYSARTQDRNRLWSEGLAYHGRWLEHAELSVGVQNIAYRRSIADPDENPQRRSDSSRRVYGIAAVALVKGTDLYAGYTQGVEDAGVAPANAGNRGEILPATRTWQRDLGLQTLIGGRLKLIAGVFDLRKPFFSFDAAGNYVRIGDQRHRGVELSVAGELLSGLNVVAGLESLRPEVEATTLGATPVGRRAVGQNDHLAQINLDYRLPFWSAASVDFTAYSFGKRAASLDNRVSLPVTRAFDLGARYRFTLGHAPASARLLVQNVSNVYSWALTESGGFAPAPRRLAQLYVTADF